MIKAMKAWSDKTCIRFVPRTNEKDYIEIFADFGKYVYILKKLLVSERFAVARGKFWWTP